MHMRTETLTPEEIEHKKHKVNRFLLEQLKDEANGADQYLEFAEKAQKLNDSQLSMLLLNTAKDEIKHFNNLMNYIETNFKDLKNNELYPLLENLQEWAETTSIEINEFK